MLWPPGIGEQFEDALTVLDRDGKVHMYSRQMREMFVRWAETVKGRRLLATEIYADCFEISDC